MTESLEPVIIVAVLILAVVLVAWALRRDG
jgi:hypothetical protein